MALGWSVHQPGEVCGLRPPAPVLRGGSRIAAVSSPRRDETTTSRRARHAPYAYIMNRKNLSSPFPPHGDRAGVRPLAPTSAAITPRGAEGSDPFAPLSSSGLSRGPNVPRAPKRAERARAAKAVRDGDGGARDWLRRVIPGLVPGIHLSAGSNPVARWMPATPAFADAGEPRHDMVLPVWIEHTTSPLPREIRNGVSY